MRKYRLNYEEHPDGTVEQLISDESLFLVLDGLETMGLSLPIKEDQWEIVEEYLEGLDIGIGQDEAEGIYPTKKYNKYTGIAMDEFLILERDEAYIDYDKVNKRLAELLNQYGKDGKYTLHYRKMHRKKEKPE